jgi:hypothetical protein
MRSSAVEPSEDLAQREVKMACFSSKTWRRRIRTIGACGAAVKTMGTARWLQSDGDGLSGSTGWRQRRWRACEVVELGRMACFPCGPRAVSSNGGPHYSSGPGLITLFPLFHIIFQIVSKDQTSKIENTTFLIPKKFQTWHGGI